jgi:proline racemase
MVHVIRSIDAHVGGAAVRLLIDGVPRPSGKTMAQKRDWMKRHASQLRRGVILEPRGHANLVGALLTEPVTPGADAGILFMDADRYLSISGAAVIAAATIAIEKGLIVGSAPRLTFDTAAGTVHAAAHVQAIGDRQRVDTVTVTGVPSFVVAGGHVVTLGSRELRVDVAYGGELLAIVDSEAIGIPLGAATLPELRRLAAQIRMAIDGAGGVATPHGAGPVAGVVFTGPPQDPEAHLRNVTIAASGAADRSPSATGTAAVMAVLDAMGLLGDDHPFVHEGIAGTLHRGRVARRTQIGEATAIVPEIEGSAWITGEHVFYMDDDDPFKDGLLL